MGKTEGVKYGSTLALKEHLLEGNSITSLEALTLFGVQDLTREITRMRREGWIIKSNKTTMLSTLRRLNEFAVIEPPKNLPIKEIMLTEYWVNR